VLDQQVNGSPLIYFDNAATTQKPKSVIDALSHYYASDNANIHRGIHALAERATTAFELTRTKIKEFINAPSSDQIILTAGTTGSINLVAQTFGRANFSKGDKILISNLEHHSNIVPWQMIAEEKGAIIEVIPVDERGVLDLNAYRNLLDASVKLVAVNHVSNAIGTINPIAEMIQLAHAHGAKVMIDGAQSIAHLDIDVQALMRTDFVKFSADINARYIYTLQDDKQVYGGLTYRTSDAIALMAGYTPINNLTVGYSYDLTVNKLSNISRGSHELVVKYCMFLKEKPVPSARHPRWL
jgi:cysteine desulfurase/selenocysteine lyase